MAYLSVSWLTLDVYMSAVPVCHSKECSILLSARIKSTILQLAAHRVYVGTIPVSIWSYGKMRPILIPPSDLPARHEGL